MLTTFIVVLVVSGALMIGALWGVFGKLGDKTEGFLLAVAGGALIEALILELIEPSMEESHTAIALFAVALGAVVFTLLDNWIEKRFGDKSGGGLLAAITLDGVPENLALGVALIGAKPMEVVALAGSIFLSNLPEAAGGARDMTDDGRSKGRVIAIWSGTALLLSAAAILGNLALSSASPHVLAVTRCFAAGAVVASLATEVFPKAYREDRNMAGIATALGLILAYLLAELGQS